jgi:hypothetical protein
MQCSATGGYLSTRTSLLGSARLPQLGQPCPGGLSTPSRPSPRVQRSPVARPSPHPARVKARIRRVTWLLRRVPLP